MCCLFGTNLLIVLDFSEWEAFLELCILYLKLWEWIVVNLSTLFIKILIKYDGRFNFIDDLTNIGINVLFLNHQVHFLLCGIFFT